MLGQSFVITGGASALTIATASPPLVAPAAAGIARATVSGGAGLAIGERQGPAGRAGPQGEPGADGRDDTYIAGTLLSGEKALMFAADGTVVAADPTAAGFVYAGVSLFAAQPGSTITARSIGDIRASFWSWAPGLPIFVASGGELTQEPPTQAVAQIIGWAASPTSIHLRAEPPVLVQS